jgi:threonine/homoserine/homoserine lactone efflux protein
VGFCAGVGLSMLVLFLVLGYTGERIIKKEYLIYISVVGSAYITWLAYKIFKSNVQLKTGQAKALSFRDGFVMQTLNPKATLAVLPIATIHFPANGVMGTGIFLVSLVLSLMAACAPLSYVLAGTFFSSRIENDRIMKTFNGLMAALLLYVAFAIFRDHVYLVLTGVNPF